MSVPVQKSSITGGPARVAGMCYGGDYNPEQWPEDVWIEDAKLMQEAGVNLATVGVFAWSWLEPAPGQYEFGWLDRVLDLLHEAGVAVDLATATAAPPAWFSHGHPEALVVDADGRRLSYGSRQSFCPSSPAYRTAALALTEQLARRYAGHPALALWHVHNEYACHNARCYCDTSAAAFRDWLRQRYANLAALNQAWGTAFWSQRYTAWEQVLPPRASTTSNNPGQLLDFHRFSSDAHLANFCAERDLLHQLSPGVPVTTNLMNGGHVSLDYWQFAAQLSGPDRLVSNDHYLVAEDPAEPDAQIAYAADLTRSLAGGPWLLMEHSTSAVNWQPRNLAKAPGQLIRNSLAHVARGSEGALFFQWRASRAGSEKWHSAMVPHAGTRTRVWREVVTLGGHLQRLAEVTGSRVRADVALLLDYPSGWAAEAPNQPSVDMTTFTEIRRWHEVLWRAGVTADLAHPGADLSSYRLVLAPALYLLDDAGATNLATFVQEGGTLVVGPYSAVVDDTDQVHLGGYPGGLRELLGVWVEEYLPLPPGHTVSLDTGTGSGWTGQVWAEHAHPAGATVVASYAGGPVSGGPVAGGPVAGGPAVTRHRAGAGTAWYVGTRLVDADLAELLEAAGAAPLLPGAPPAVEAVRRQHDDPGQGSYLFLLNHGEQDAPVQATGTDLLTGLRYAGTVPAGGVVVLREES